MDFVTPYKEWLDYNGGVKSAISNTTDKSLMLHKINVKRFLPGHIYRFEYLNRDELSKFATNTAEHLYYDKHPVMLSLGYDPVSKKEIGLNLNVMPYQSKFNMFRNIYKRLDRIIIKELSQPHDDWKPWNITEERLNEIYRIPSRVGINKYARQYMRKIEAVDWGSAVKLTTFYEKNSLILNKKKKINLVKLLKMSL